MARSTSLAEAVALVPALILVFGFGCGGSTHRMQDDRDATTRSGDASHEMGDGGGPRRGASDDASARSTSDHDARTPDDGGVPRAMRDAQTDTQDGGSQTMQDGALDSSEAGYDAARDAEMPDATSDAKTRGPEVAPAIIDLCAAPAGWELTAPLAGPPPPPKQGSFVPLAFDLTRARYDRALDRFVGVSSNPAALRVFSTSGQVELNVALSAAPTALSVAPNGKRAAVGTASAVLLVDLESGSLTTLAFPDGVYDLVDTGDSTLYVETGVSSGNSYELTSLDIASGTITVATNQPAANGSPLAVLPEAQRLYFSGITDIARYDIAHGAPVYEATISTQRSYCTDTLVVASAAGLLDACGQLRNVADDPAHDLSYRTRLPTEFLVNDAAESAARGELAVVFDERASGLEAADSAPILHTQVQVFGDTYLNPIASATLPDFTENGQSAPLWGRFVAYSSDDQTLYVIAQTPSDASVVSLRNRVALVAMPAALAAPDLPVLDDVGPYRLLGSTVIDAQMSRELERFVLITDHPAQLVVLDPRTQTARAVDLPVAATKLRLSPSGRRALVVYGGWLAYYELDPLSLLRTLTTDGEPRDVGLDDEEHVYALVAAFSDLFTGDLNTGASTKVTNNTLSGFGRYVDYDHAFYAAAADQFVRIPVSQGALGTSTRSDGEFDPCWSWFPSRDRRALGGCGHVFSASSDTRYLGTLAGWSSANYGAYQFVFESDQSPIARLVASVPTDHATTPGTSREVQLHEDHYLTQVGSLRLPVFSAGGNPVLAYSRYAFFSEDGTRLDVLAEANPTAGILRDYGLISADLTQLATCPSEPATLIPVTGSENAGVRLTALPFDVVDAKISRALDRIVIVSSAPPGLHVLDPATVAISADVELPVPPTCVELEADGRSAVVGHDGWLSRVALTQTEATLSATLPLSTVPSDIAVGGDEAFVVPKRQQAGSLHVVGFGTGVDTLGARIGYNSLMRVTPDGQSLLNVQPETSSDDDLRRMSLVDARKPPNPYDFGQGGTDIAADVGHFFWFASDGKRVFGSGTGVFDSSDLGAATFAKLGSLQGITGVRALDHSGSRGRIALVPRQYDANVETDVRLFDDTSYTQLASTQLPPFQLPSGKGTGQTHGRFVFFSSDASAIYVIVEAVNTQPLSARFGLVRVPASN